MEIHEYPRPANDTGIGIHWAPGYAAAVGMARIRELWIPELRSLGVKWVKIYNHDGALDFAELLLAEGFMPVVRIYRPSPNPGRLSLREIVHVDSFVRAGARYFEFNSEPDRDSEWKGGRVPANGLELVAEDTIANLDAILERGGMPAIPAVANGSTWDLVGKIIAKGRKDLFDGPVWQAVHNYCRNRPLDYPYDIGNQEGAAFTERFYRTVADEQWDENAWRGRSLVEINRLRLDRCSPGASLREDHACWLSFQHFDALNRHHLGRSIPIMATESGYLVGDDSDARYPATTPNLHMAQTLEVCRILMGTSTRFPAAPDYLLCAHLAVIANQQMGGNSAWWEKYAWFSNRWGNGSLPIVRALRAEPKVVRKRQGNVAGAPLIRLRGAVLNTRERQTVVLERNGLQVASTPLDQNNRFQIDQLSPGAYVLRVAGTPVEQAVNLSQEQSEMVINLDMGVASESASRSLASGTVEGGAGSTVILLRHSDGEEYVTMAREDGGYRFVDLPPGSYSLRVSPDGARAESLYLDGRNQVDVNLAVAGWGHTVSTADATSGIGSVRVRVRGRRGATVQVHGVGGSSQPIFTGLDPELGEDECQLNGLENGLYIVTASDLLDEEGRLIEPEARVTVDRKRIPLVEFSFHDKAASTTTALSSIVGRVIGPLEQVGPLNVRLLDSQARSSDTRIGDDGSFRFDKLTPGIYAVEVAGHEAAARRQDIALDGLNQVSIDLLLPFQMRAGAAAQSGGRSVIQATAPGAAGKLARLVDAVGNEQRLIVKYDSSVRFENLPAGDYALTIDGGFAQDGLSVDGQNGRQVDFAPLTSAWEVLVNKAESMPGYSVARVEVQGKADLPVYIWREDWEGMMKRSGSSSEHGPYALEFSPLGPGTYMIEPEGLGVWTDVQLSGLEAVWITFRPRSEPTSPNLVSSLKPLPAAQSAQPGPLPGVAEKPVRRRHYIWLGDTALGGRELTDIFAFAARENAIAGSDLNEALSSDIVTIVGDPALSPGLDELRRKLSARGIVVRRYDAKFAGSRG